MSVGVTSLAYDGWCKASRTRVFPRGYPPRDELDELTHEKGGYNAAFFVRNFYEPNLANSDQGKRACHVAG